MTNSTLAHLNRSPWFHVLGGPIIWTVHFLISYVWIEFACRVESSVLHSNVLGLTILSWSVLGFTLAAIFTALYVGWSAYQNWKRLKRSNKKNELDLWALEAQRFMAFSGIFLALLFSLVILLSGLPVLVLKPCT